jgi:hypothetical protein
VHPLLFTPALLILHALSCDTPHLIQLAPRLTQATLTLAHDAAITAFAHAHFPASFVLPTLAVSTLSWFNNFTHARPYSNTVESTLHLMCLTLWPQALPTPARRRLRAAALCCAGLCCVIRPTSAALFLPLAVAEALVARKNPASSGAHALMFAADSAGLATAFLLAAAIVDRGVYGRWVVPTVANVRFNVLENGSSVFGEHPPHWYATHGLPAMLASLLPLVVHGAIAASSYVHAPRWPLALAAWGVAVHSALPHKEFRFILPSFELLLPYAAISATLLLQTVPPATRSTLVSAPVATKESPQCVTRSVAAQIGQLHLSKSDTNWKPPLDWARQRPGRAQYSSAVDLLAVDRASCAGTAALPSGAVRRGAWRRGLLVAAATLLLLLQVPTLLYFALWHQRGTVAAAEWLGRASLTAVGPSDLCRHCNGACFTVLCCLGSFYGV